VYLPSNLPSVYDDDDGDGGASDHEVVLSCTLAFMSLNEGETDDCQV